MICTAQEVSCKYRIFTYSSTSFTAHLYVNGAVVSDGTGRSEEEAKDVAATYALIFLTRQKELRVFPVEQLPEKFSARVDTQRLFPQTNNIDSIVLQNIVKELQIFANNPRLVKMYFLRAGFSDYKLKEDLVRTVKEFKFEMRGNGKFRNARKEWLGVNPKKGYPPLKFPS